MASTNKTAHYELSQYVSSDKPTYLSDYNGDMAKIDTGINAAKTTADTASTAATNAATAAETAQTTANTAVTNAATAQTTADGANTKIGTLANLVTSEKTNLVGAINEVSDITSNLVVDTLANNETIKAPSVHIVKTNIDSLNEYKPVTLWTNNDSSVSFGSQNITLASNTYDMLVVICQIWGGDGVNGRKYITGTLKGSNITLDVAGDYGGAIANFERTMSRVSDTVYQVSACTVKTPTSSSTDNAFAIPVKIIGYKL